MSHRRNLSLALCVALCVAFVAALLLMVGDFARAQSSTRYVATTGADVGICADHDLPCRSVQYAVDQAEAGDVVKVAAGLYTGVTERPAPPGYEGPPLVRQLVYLTKTVTVRGGYTTTNGFADPSDPIGYPTTLDAQWEGRVLFIAGAISPTLTGLRITGGDAVGQGGAMNQSDAGGGVYIVTSAPTIRDVELFGNTAGYGGGGLYLGGSSALVDGNNIRNNTAQYEGGGLWLVESPATLVNNIVSANSAGGSSGGGLSLWNSDATLTWNVVSSNSAYSGGGIFLYDSAAVVRGNTVVSNSATGHGGGLGLHYSNANLAGNWISGNTAGSRGGGLALGHSDAILINNVIVENEADDLGCALYIDDSFPRLSHSTIARNTGSSGIGVTGVGYSIAMTNTILVGHTVGIEISAGNSAYLEATLWGSDDWANETDWAGSGTIITGTINIWGNPAFVGPTAGDYHIGPDSEAIDLGVDAGVRDDIDGQPRPGGTGYDLGADEYWLQVFLPLVLRDSP